MPAGTSITEQHARQVGNWPNIEYSTWPNRRNYKFTFTLVGGSWRVYIIKSPSYGRRDSGSLATHRLDIGGRTYICWDRPIDTLSSAQAVASLWADSTEHYIATGRFVPPHGRPAPTDWSVLNGFPGQVPPARPGAARRPAPAPVPVALRPAISPWYEDSGHVKWGLGLGGLLIGSLAWIVCMSNGFGFWDFVWLAAVGGATAFTHQTVDKLSWTARGGQLDAAKGTVIAQGITTGVLGIANVWGAPGLLWAAYWLLLIVNGSLFAYSAYRHDTGNA